jgi:hypothetical protein
MAQNKYAIDLATALSRAQRDSVLPGARASLDPAIRTIPWMKIFLSYDPVVAAWRP